MAVRPQDPNVVEENAAGQQFRFRDLAPGGDAHLLELRDTRGREAFAVGESLLIDFEDIAPVLLTRLVAHVSHARSVE